MRLDIAPLVFQMPSARIVELHPFTCYDKGLHEKLRRGRSHQQPLERLRLYNCDISKWAMAALLRLRAVQTLVIDVERKEMRQLCYCPDNHQPWVDSIATAAPDLERLIVTWNAVDDLQLFDLSAETPLPPLDVSKLQKLKFFAMHTLLLCGDGAQDFPPEVAKNRLRLVTGPSIETLALEIDIPTWGD